MLNLPEKTHWHHGREGRTEEKLSLCELVDGGLLTEAALKKQGERLLTVIQYMVK